ncbi:hypothetical protein [Pseudofrankia inefficax]|uniref:Uncharacterized protein n=1 Tax=Pseudofrankia inefficax (strain DSM 45817 / CECT 9037 / DDB 130130 / EuI1c) TaxID=298654 RepID=E3J5I9_PSEI1|nr:hypothetical protein [Pseudofrankia inefficax]ADP81933.1 hypothetical protein FraEuI1c_3927 [Pseudofrankia inefficax]
MSNQENWADVFISQLMYPALEVLVNTVLLGLSTYYVVHAFNDNVSLGARTAAVTLIPLIVVTYLVKNLRQPLARAASAGSPRVTFALTTVVGFSAFLVLRQSTSLALDGFVLSLVFSALIGVRASLQEDRRISYLFGAALGGLLAVATIGLPGT